MFLRHFYYSVAASNGHAAQEVDLPRKYRSVPFQCQLVLIMGIAILIGLHSPIFAADNSKPKFLFSEDDQILPALTKSDADVPWPSKTIIRDDKWLNQPLTRLDYILGRMETTLTADNSAVAQELIAAYFEKYKLGIAPSVTFSVQYSDENGRLFIGAMIDLVGKPKAPMRDFCKAMLGYIELSYPLKPDSRWDIKALGALERDKDTVPYRDAIRDLAGSAISVVQVSSEHETAGKGAVFSVSCNRQEADGPITYHKNSTPMSATP